MVSPQIKITILLAGVSIGYAFFCQIRLTQKASKLADLLLKTHPDLWMKLSFIARSSNGGYPGIKILYRKRVISLPGLDQEYKQMVSIERRLFWGIIVGMLCIATVIIGLQYLDWHW